ncbi:hypothetical protein E2562_007884 [Oryza meyeriana var. granulata]|uniref:DUF2828 domain-containing protein n=1 Tax=Oryza meyeriana var. granulata TaxID=110450 RepID=A0A6G1F596_9ORYZ|nr:hypothetical protein E2562_007884 [Oryza meyeriana var. granulata]
MFGYLKDFPELLFHLLHDPSVRKAASSAREAILTGRKRGQGHALARSIVNAMAPTKPLLTDSISAALLLKTKTKPKPKRSNNPKLPEKKEISKKARKAVKLPVQSLEKYYADCAYCLLFDCVVEFFARLLASNLKQLAPSGQRMKMGAIFLGWGSRSNY